MSRINRGTLIEVAYAGAARGPAPLVGGSGGAGPSPPVGPDVTPDYWEGDAPGADPVWTGTRWEQQFTGQVGLRRNGDTNPDWWVGYRPSQVEITWQWDQSGIQDNAPIEVTIWNGILFTSVGAVQQPVDTDVTIDYVTAVPLNWTGVAPDFDIFKIDVGPSGSQTTGVSVSNMVFTP